MKNTRDLRQIQAIHHDGALLRIDIHHLFYIPFNDMILLHIIAHCAVNHWCFKFGCSGFFAICNGGVIGKLSNKTKQPVQLILRRCPLIKLVTASAPALIIGLSGLLGLAVSSLIIELNGSPVGSCPTYWNTFSVLLLIARAPGLILLKYFAGWIVYQHLPLSGTYYSHDKQRQINPIDPLYRVPEYRMLPFHFWPPFCLFYKSLKLFIVTTWHAQNPPYFSSNRSVYKEVHVYESDKAGENFYNLCWKGVVLNMSIIQIKGNVQYKITIDPSVWIFDDRKFLMDSFLRKVQQTKSSS